MAQGLNAYLMNNQVIDEQGLPALGGYMMPTQGDINQANLQAEMMPQGPVEMGPDQMAPLPQELPQAPIQMSPMDQAVQAEQEKLVKKNMPKPMPDRMAVQPKAIQRASVEKYRTKADEALASEQAGLASLENYINQFAGQPNKTDYTALAAWADSLKPGSNLLDAAKALQPMSQEHRVEKYVALQDALQRRREATSKNALAPLQAEIRAYQAMMNPLGLARMMNFGERQNQDASQAGQAFEKDKIMQDLKGTQYQLARAEGILQGDEPITGKTFNALQQDFINALAPGGAATEGKVSREMVDTISAEINNIRLKFGDVKDLRKDPAAKPILDNIAGLISQVKDEYTGGMARQATDIHSSFQYNSNPKVQQTIKNKLGRYSPEAYQSIYGEPTPHQPATYGVQPKAGGGGHGKAPEAEDPAKSRLEELRQKAGF